MGLRFSFSLLHRYLVALISGTLAIIFFTQRLHRLLVNRDLWLDCGTYGHLVDQTHTIVLWSKLVFMAL